MIIFKVLIGNRCDTDLLLLNITHLFTHSLPTSLIISYLVLLTLFTTENMLHAPWRCWTNGRSAASFWCLLDFDGRANKDSPFSQRNLSPYDWKGGWSMPMGICRGLTLSGCSGFYGYMKRSPGGPSACLVYFTWWVWGFLAKILRKYDSTFVLDVTL